MSCFKSVVNIKHKYFTLSASEIATEFKTLSICNGDKYKLKYLNTNAKQNDFQGIKIKYIIIP